MRRCITQGQFILRDAFFEASLLMDRIGQQEDRFAGLWQSRQKRAGGTFGLRIAARLG